MVVNYEPPEAPTLARGALHKGAATPPLSDPSTSLRVTPLPYGEER